MKTQYQKAKDKKIIQRHHVSYEPEVTTTVFKGEHWVLCQLARRKHLSKGFLKCLEQYVKDHWHIAKELDGNGN